MKPADIEKLVLLSRLNRRSTREDSANVIQGNPVLPLIRKDVVHHIEELSHLDLNTQFFPHFALERVLVELVELDRASWKLPEIPLVLRLRSPQCEQEPAFAVHDDSPDSNADVAFASFHALFPAFSIEMLCLGREELRPRGLLPEEPLQHNAQSQYTEVI